MSTAGVVVFDLGKVLLDFDYGIAARRIAARGRLTPPQALRLIDQSPLLFAFETGTLTAPEFFQAVRDASGFLGCEEEFNDLFADIFTPIPEMVDLHQKLRQIGVPTFVFSNTNELAVRHIRRLFPFFSEFDGHVLSYEEGSMKPDSPIYEAVERLTQLSGDRILYIDDRLENITAGAARRWRTIHHIKPRDTTAAIHEAGLL